MIVPWTISIEFLPADLCGPDEWAWSATKKKGGKHRLRGRSRTRDAAIDDARDACRSYNPRVDYRPQSFVYEVEDGLAEVPWLGDR